MLKMLKVSNESVEATGEGLQKPTVLGSTGKGSLFKPGVLGSSPARDCS